MVHLAAPLEESQVPPGSASNRDITVVSERGGLRRTEIRNPIARALKLEKDDHPMTIPVFAAHHFHLPVANLDARSIWLCLVASLAALSLSSLRTMMSLPLSSLVSEYASTSLGQRSLIYYAIRI